MERQKNVVITGASTGIGEACTLHLHKQGFRVFAGVRKQADADRLVEAAPGGNVFPILMDVTEPESLAKAAEKVKELSDDGGLTGLVNNAGISVNGPLELLPIDALRRQLEVNVIGQVAATQSFLPLLRPGGGRVVNVGSVNGRIAPPILGPYSMSKFALAAFNDALRRELHPWRIHVCLIEAGAIATPIWKKSAEQAGKLFKQLPKEARELYRPMVESVRKLAAEASESAAPVEEVARVVLKALTSPRPRTIYRVGSGTGWPMRLLRVLPDRAVDWLIRKRMGM